MYKIVYNSNPRFPKEYNHLGCENDCTEQSEKSFDKLDDAVDFHLKCSSPVSSLLEFTQECVEQWQLDESIVVEILTRCSLRDKESPLKEQLLKSQKVLYNLEEGNELD
jgi:hypothetical protein